jgi:hypothetical protein
MGHSDPTMGGHYRERIEDERLIAVSDHVRAWLFPSSPGRDKEKKQTRGSHGASPRKRSPRESKDEGPALRLYVG